ncbi:hypothetical protein [Nocardioides sp.]|uniref:hypothetical protein n=1 Tax=Nocardioides sp. TaxID=35761 RepID=UPI002722E327|nr:hypothetical protein [Nocardioides sp.]MDO9457233.1 hypothetical protein [Nocardioides sp.]
MIAKTAGLTLAFLLLAVGALWTFQGLGYIDGSEMSGSRTWATIGPVVAGLGLALGIVVVQRSRDRS